MTASLLEYRIAGLQRRLAEDGTAELGIRVEARNGLVLVNGTVPSTACRDELLDVIAAELDGLPVRTDIAVAETLAPDHPEVLS
jgi:hypothetical protein